MFDDLLGSKDENPCKDKPIEWYATIEYECHRCGKIKEMSVDNTEMPEGWIINSIGHFECDECCITFQYRIDNL